MVLDHDRTMAPQAEMMLTRTKAEFELVLNPAETGFRQDWALWKTFPTCWYHLTGSLIVSLSGVASK
jgi:hypothetical protein